MFRSGGCCSGSHCSSMEHGLWGRKRGRPPGGHAASGRRFRKVPHCSPRIVRHRQRSAHPLLLLLEFSSLHALPSGGAPICLLDPLYGNVSSITTESHLFPFTWTCSDFACQHHPSLHRWSNEVLLDIDKLPRPDRLLGERIRCGRNSRTLDHP